MSILQVVLARPRNRDRERALDPARGLLGAGAPSALGPAPGPAEDGDAHTDVDEKTFMISANPIVAIVDRRRPGSFATGCPSFRSARSSSHPLLVADAHRMLRSGQQRERRASWRCRFPDLPPSASGNHSSQTGRYRFRLRGASSMKGPGWLGRWGRRGRLRLRGRTVCRRQAAGRRISSAVRSRLR
jgi:hypothetical protein